MKTQSKAIFAAMVTYVLWGFSFLASSVGQETATPFVLLTYRFVIAVAILSVPILLGKQKIRLRGKNIKPLLLLGAMEPCIYFIGEQYGLKYSNSAFSGVMIALIPIVTLILAAVFLKERPSRAQWLFSLISIGGIIVITAYENSGGDVSIIGVVFLLAAVITGSAYSVISRSIADEFSVFERTYIMQVMGAVFFTVLALIEQSGFVGAILAPALNTDFVIAALFLAVGSSVLGYTLFNYAVSNAPMANIAILCNLTTVISVVAGIFILHEKLSAVSLVAMAVVIIGIWGVQRFSPKEQ